MHIRTKVGLLFLQESSGDCWSEETLQNIRPVSLFVVEKCDFSKATMLCFRWKQLIWMLLALGLENAGQELDLYNTIQTFCMYGFLYDHIRSFDCFIMAMFAQESAQIGTACISMYIPISFLVRIQDAKEQWTFTQTGQSQTPQLKRIWVTSSKEGSKNRDEP